MEPQVVTEVDQSPAGDTGETRRRDSPQPDPVESCQAVQDTLASSPMENLNTNIGTGETSSKNCPQPNPEESPNQPIQDRLSISLKDNSATVTAWPEDNMVSLNTGLSGCHLHLGLIKGAIIDTHHFVHYEAREGQTRQPPSFMPEYTNMFIPVLHRGVITCAVHKCDLCCYRCGTRYTYAHSWDERLE